MKKFKVLKQFGNKVSPVGAVFIQGLHEPNHPDYKREDLWWEESSDRESNQFVHKAFLRELEEEGSIEFLPQEQESN